jgi:hypothetical protein
MILVSFIGGIGPLEMLIMGCFGVFVLGGAALVAFLAVRRPQNNSSLVPCPDCGRRLSPQAATCPQCGRPMT